MMIPCESVLESFSHSLDTLPIDGLFHSVCLLGILFNVANSDCARKEGLKRFEFNARRLVVETGQAAERCKEWVRVTFMPCSRQCLGGAINTVPIAKWHSAVHF